MEIRTYTAAVPAPGRAISALLRCVVLTALVTACGGPTLQSGVFRDAEAHYRIGDLGPGWSRLSVAGQNDLAWHNESLGAIVQLNATCDPSRDVPLTALTNHLLIGFREREIVEQEFVSMDAREALRTHAVATLDGVPRELLFVVLKKDDCVYDFALITPPGTPFSGAQPAFEHFVSGFTTEVQ
ncbi:Hypothetical protein I5071_48220 [Sandaracinus amylolyticus]|nr:Hypothetical protein I5071_48220 [Sandaracinus amylolyticus]